MGLGAKASQQTNGGEGRRQRVPIPNSCRLRRKTGARRFPKGDRGRGKTEAAGQIMRATRRLDHACRRQLRFALATQAQPALKCGVPELWNHSMPFFQTRSPKLNRPSDGDAQSGTAELALPRQMPPAPNPLATRDGYAAQSAMHARYQPRPRIDSARTAKAWTVGLNYEALRKECLDAVKQWPGCETVGAIRIIRNKTPGSFSLQITLYGKAPKKTADRASSYVERQKQRYFHLTD